ncbi:hypothetical protein [Moraxella lacunata]|uniref:hypothetical protein n=1 Tax=Moraxella lacunata TaxID=477 RepID=UPI003EE02CFC
MINIKYKKNHHSKNRWRTSSGCTFKSNHTQFISKSYKTVRPSWTYLMVRLSVMRQRIDQHTHWSKRC